MMIVDVPLNLGCTHSRMGEHPVCSPQPLLLPLMRRRKMRSRSQARKVTAARHAQPTVFQEKRMEVSHLEEEGEDHSIVISGS